MCVGFMGGATNWAIGTTARVFSNVFFSLAWGVSFPKWVQIFSRGREGGDRVAGTVWEQMGENRYVSAWKN